MRPPLNIYSAARPTRTPTSEARLSLSNGPAITIKPRLSAKLSFLACPAEGIDKTNFSSSPSFLVSDQRRARPLGVGEESLTDDVCVRAWVDEEVGWYGR